MAVAAASKLSILKLHNCDKAFGNGGGRQNDKMYGTKKGRSLKRAPLIFGLTYRRDTWYNDVIKDGYPWAVSPYFEEPELMNYE
jgi:hypothetical protein